MKICRVCGQFHGRTIVLHLVDSVKVVEVMGLTSGLRFSPPKKISPSHSENAKLHVGFEKFFEVQKLYKSDFLCHQTGYT